MAREKTKKIARTNWKLWLSLSGLAAVCASTAVAGLMVREYALTDATFTLSRDRSGSVIVEGLQYAARYKVQRVFTADFGRSIFAVPLAERRRRLLAIDWVEDASVSRIWPGSLVVRLRERKPVAFVSLRGAVSLIDAHGVLLDPPPESRFAFPVLTGVRAEDSEIQRRERVRLFQEVLKEMGYLAKDISELNAADPDNVRIVVQLEGRAVHLMLGGGNYAQRYSNFLHYFPEISKRSPDVVTFDLRLDESITATRKK